MALKLKVLQVYIALIFSLYANVLSQPANIIFDTDMAQDVDDVGALAILHKLADNGECNLLGVGVSTPVNVYDGYWAAACVSVINKYYERPSVPIGGYRGTYNIPDRVSNYTEKVANSFPHELKNGLQTQDAFKLYREILASQPDASVTFVVVGYLTNMELLLDSKPDEYSPLNGIDLVSKKVKLLSCMGGNFRNGDEEFNFNTYPRSTLYVLSNWPTKAVFGGGELGSMVKCGKVLNETYKTSENPVAMAWQYFIGGQQRESWDELSALFAVRGCSNYFRLSEAGQTFFWMRGGDYIPGINNSRNEWLPLPKGKHHYLLPVMQYDDLGRELDKILLEKPLIKGSLQK